MKIAALGLLIAGITPIALANSSRSVSLPDQLQFSSRQSHAVAFKKSCDESTFSCPTKPNNFDLIDSSFGLQKIATSLLPNVLFSTCDYLLPARSEVANNALANPESSLQMRSGISLSSLSTTVSSKCGFPWEQQLHPTATSIDLEPTLTTKQNIVSSKLGRPDFPKLSRSSLIVSFPQENSNFVLKNKKLANPAPETKRIASPFGWRKRPYSNQLQFHQGVDYGASYGSTVVAVGNGIVTKVVTGCADFGNLFCGGQLGNWIEIDHGNGIVGTYGHLKYSSVTIQPGTKVRKNQPIAQVGSSGWSTGAHLDFRLKVNGKYEDPAKHVMALEEIKKDGVIFSEVN